MILLEKTYPPPLYTVFSQKVDYRPVRLGKKAGDHRQSADKKSQYRQKTSCLYNGIPLCDNREITFWSVEPDLVPLLSHNGDHHGTVPVNHNGTLRQYVYGCR